MESQKLKSGFSELLVFNKAPIIKRSSEKIHERFILPILLAMFLITGNLMANGQQQVVKGFVKDAGTNEPLPGVNIIIKGTTTGGVTDMNGNFELNVSSGAILVFSYIGYLAEEIEITDQNSLEVFMVADIAQLGEVIVIGYGTVKKSDLTGSVVSVRNEDLTAIPVTNALELLQGKVAGMDMTKNSGEAGSDFDFRIRGQRSINATNKPFIIVDGIPYGENIDINPQDIESIEVLKDASSTAIYGSRGANGVILVTTKRGNANKPQLSFNMYAGPNTVVGYPEFTDGPEWVAMRREAYRVDGTWASEEDDPAIFSGYYQLIQDGEFMNWQEEIIQQGFVQNYQIGLSGGNEKTVYSISADYNKEEGVLRNDILNRYTIRTTLDHTFNDRIKIGTSIHYVVSDRDRRGNPFNQANKQPPLGIPYDVEGKINVFPFGNEIYSPLADEIPNAYTNNQSGRKMLSTSYLDIKILNSLVFKSTLGLTYTDTRNGFYADRYSLSRSGQPSLANVENINTGNWQWENFLTLDKTLGNHSFQLVAGTSAMTDKKETFFAEGIDVFSNFMQFYNLLATDVTQISINSDYRQEQLLSFFGRLNYTLFNKYLFTLVARADGASVLAPGNKWQSFPSAAFAWKVHEEGFMQSQSLVSQLKLRTSYGISGNSSVQPYQTDSRLGQTMYSWDETPAQGYYLRAMAAEGLGWETTSTFNIGADIGVFGNRMSLTVERYWQHTYDLLLERKLPTGLGYVSVIDNIGETKNQGFEMTVNSVNLTGSSGLKWTTDITFSHNNEKIVALADSTTEDIANGLFVGYPRDVHYDFKKIGIWQRQDSLLADQFGGFVPGEIRVMDYVNDTSFGADDKHIIGNPRPKWTMGINNRFEYKGVDLSFFIFARIGQMISSEAHSRFDMQALGVSIDADYWTPENPTNAYPRPNRTAPHRELISTLGYVDGSFVKIRDVSLGYTLPSKFTSKVKISNLRFYSTMKNYFTFSNLNPYDPERGGSASFPMTKQWIFGVNLTF